MAAPAPSSIPGGGATSSPGNGGPCADAATGLSPGGGALPHRPQRRRTRRWLGAMDALVARCYRPRCRIPVPAVARGLLHQHAGITLGHGLQPPATLRRWPPRGGFCSVPVLHAILFLTSPSSSCPRRRPWACSIGPSRPRPRPPTVGPVSPPTARPALCQLLPSPDSSAPFRRRPHTLPCAGSCPLLTWYSWFEQAPKSQHSCIMVTATFVRISVSGSVKRCRAMLDGVCALQAWLTCYEKLRIIRFEGVMSLSRSRPNVCKEGVRLTWTSLCGLQSLSCDLNAAPTETWLLNGAGCWNERTNEEWTEVVAT
jgi:hypothetical protein